MKWIHEWLSAGASLLRYYLLQFFWAVLIWVLHYKTTKWWVTTKEKMMGLEKDIPIPAIGGDLDVLLDSSGNAVVVVKGAKTITASGTMVELDIKVTQPAKALLDKLVALVPAGWVHDALAAGEKAALAAGGVTTPPSA